MTRIVHRQAFSKKLQNKQIDVDQLKHDKKLKQAVAEAGGDIKNLARADLDRDGTIKGTREVDRLFTEVDRLEQGVNPNAFLAQDRAGNDRPAGEAYDRLSFLAKNKKESQATTHKQPAQGLQVPAPGLQRGAKGAPVKQLQQALVQLGHMSKTEYRTGPGIFGPRTQEAVEEFQRKHGVKPTGEYGPVTRAALAKALAAESTPAAPARRSQEPAKPAKPAEPSTKAAIGKGMPDTSGLSTAKRFAVYEQYISQFGDAQAKKDLAAGKRVILGLRKDTPMTSNRPYRGTYDDRVVVLWKDKSGPHVKELAANTEPNRRWSIPANQSSKPVGRLADNQSIRYHKAWNSNFGNHLQPAGSPYAQRDTDRDYKFEKGEKKYTGNWGGQSMFIHRAWSSDTGSQGCQTMEEGRFSDFWRSLGAQRNFSYVLVNVAKG